MLAPHYMKATFFRTHGGPEVLEHGELPTPEPGPGEVLVQVEACGLNHLDIWVREGLGMEIPMPHIGGCETVGTIAAFGSGVTGWSAGDRVLVSPGIGADNSLSPDYQVKGFHT
jgi:NADPH:quinone reductase-like Zn-dependent oxidoreductase